MELIKIERFQPFNAAKQQLKKITEYICQRVQSQLKKGFPCPMTTTLETVTISLKPSLKVKVMNIQGVSYVSIPSSYEVHMHRYSRHTQLVVVLSDCP